MPLRKSAQNKGFMSTSTTMFPKPNGAAETMAMDGGAIHTLIIRTGNVL